MISRNTSNSRSLDEEEACHGFIIRSPGRTRTLSLISHQLEYNARRGGFTRQTMCSCLRKLRRLLDSCLSLGMGADSSNLNDNLKNDLTQKNLIINKEIEFYRMNRDMTSLIVVNN